jgi:hypothetical protein
MTTPTVVKLPKEWVNSTFDINIYVYADVSVVDDSWDIRVDVITTPGYWCFHFLPEYKQDLYELIEKSCIREYIRNNSHQIELEFDHHD